MPRDRSAGADETSSNEARQDPQAKEERIPEQVREANRRTWKPLVIVLVLGALLWLAIALAIQLRP